jgi:hypothetical protein
MAVQAVCTWGDGPDVLISVNARETRNGYTTTWVDLTAAEARRLAAELLVAAERAEELAAGAKAPT